MKFSKEDARAAKKVVLEMLADRGIPDNIVVKVKTIKKHPEWLALYRSRTQFRGHGPIFWVNENLPEIVERIESELDETHGRSAHLDPLTVTVDTLLHEYGHVVYEYATVRPDQFTIDVLERWPDQEEFAEDFIEYIRSGWIDPSYEKVIDEYKKAVFVEE